ncbi:MAG: hypothetical protein KatS3mg019_0923 [Fimbriimonadales bacterium]|nr:MAG: hypothetical protein KatS3mg019_0923 [Fimbriimonadales bacterium]
MTRPIIVRTPRGTPIATITNGVLRRAFQSSRHLLRQPPALAIARDLYRRYRSRFHTLEFVCTETGKRYVVDAITFDRYSFGFNQGYGEQLALPLRYWQCIDPNAKQLTLEV